MATPNESESPQPVQPAPQFQLSLDWWAVIVALVLVTLILLNILPAVTW